jgi:penicillin-insensitive murein DD-endopeptidase
MVVRVHWLAVLVGAAQLALLSSPAAAETNATGSISCGAANRGALAGARAIPDSGEGYVAPEPWRARGLRYATDELVGLIERAAARVAREYDGALVGVADLSAAQGGAVARHASHQSGRDADLIYYAIDRDGDPFPPDRHMAYYGADGRSVSAEAPEPAGRIDERYFDLQRNWALIAALVTDPDVRVYRIFVSTRVRDWLLAYASAAAMPPDLVARVRSVLSTARDTGTHQDHMHLRIACSADDVAAGRCSDETAAPPRRRRGKRRGRHRPPPARKWYAHIRCGTDSDAVAGADAPDRPREVRRSRSARAKPSGRSQRRPARVRGRPAAGR